MRATIGGNLMIWVMIFIEKVILAIYGYYVNKLVKLNDQCEICIKTKDYKKFDRLKDTFNKTNLKADKWCIRLIKLSDYVNKNKKLLKDEAQ